MTNRNQSRGTAWETAIVRYLQSRGRAHVERRAKTGALDRGDIAGIPGVVIEAKAEKRITLAEYIDETEVEQSNAAVRVGVAWVKRRGRTSPGSGYVVMSGAQFVTLLEEAGY